VAERGGAAVVVRDVVRIEGPDAALYLQGQLSQDVLALAVGDSAWTFVLQPQGKVDAWFRLTRVADEAFVADVDAGHGEAVLARLRRFLLRTKAELSVSAEPMVAVRGIDVVSAPEGVPALDPAWPGVAGVDLLGTDVVPDGLAVLTTAALERLRIEAGVPAMGAELTERTIPAEAGVVDRSVSFTKGCFTGQELVARIDSRGGNVPRHLRLLVADGAEPLPVGAEVLVDGKGVGEVTSSAPGEDGRPAVALAYVGRAVEPPVEAEVAGVSARVEALPQP
jgi:folate-binding protein YgfZ